MGDINQLNFIKGNRSLVSASVLEVGSKDYGNTPDFRSLFPGFEYIGIDMEEGKGVDLIVDLTDDFELVNNKLAGKRFKTIICFSVLEHCKNPFKMSQNITNLLDENGILFISVPFSWRIHSYPSDYWRFTPDGIKVLFPKIDFESFDNNLSTCKTGEVGPINNYMFRAELDISKGIKLKRINYIESKIIKFCRRLKILPSIFSYPYLFPPVMVNMIGIKKKDKSN